MKIRSYYSVLVFLQLILVGCNGIISKDKNEVTMNKKKQEQIIEAYLKKGAWNYHYTTKEWHEWIDKGLLEDSTIAYLWQQKVLPYWKTRKYEVAIGHYDKAVKYDRKKYLSRHGFLKCVFARKYKSALDDLSEYIEEYGNKYENDHNLYFYQSLCFLGLNDYEKALTAIQKSIEFEKKLLIKIQIYIIWNFST